MNKIFCIINKHFRDIGKYYSGCEIIATLIDTKRTQHNRKPSIEEQFKSLGTDLCEESNIAFRRNSSGTLALHNSLLYESLT